MMDCNEQVGACVRQIRNTRSRTIDSVALSVGITKGYLSQLEKGKRRWNVECILLIATELGITPGALIDMAMSQKNNRVGI